MKKLLFVAILAVSGAAYAQHYVHNWMQTGCQFTYVGGRQVQICTMVCLIGGETVVVQR